LGRTGLLGWLLAKCLYLVFVLTFPVGLRLAPAGVHLPGPGVVRGCEHALLGGGMLLKHIHLTGCCLSVGLLALPVFSLGLFSAPLPSCFRSLLDALLDLLRRKESLLGKAAAPAGLLLGQNSLLYCGLPAGFFVLLCGRGPHASKNRRVVG
jgi:hypothetical protein